MKPQNEAPPSSIVEQRIVRVAATVMVLVPLGLLVTAGRLYPDPSGIGTHRQLGLPPCSTRLLLGIRCPACGMTTSWSHFAQGHFRQSAASNIGGFLLAMFSLALLPVAAKMGWQGKLPARNTQRWIGFTVVGITAVILVSWVTRVWG